LFHHSNRTTLRLSTGCERSELSSYKRDNRYVIFLLKKLLERLDQAILDVFDNPVKNQQTIAIGTLFQQTL